MGKTPRASGLRGRVCPHASWVCEARGVPPGRRRGAATPRLDASSVMGFHPAPCVQLRSPSKRPTSPSFQTRQSGATVRGRRSASPVPSPPRDDPLLPSAIPSHAAVAVQRVRGPASQRSSPVWLKQLLRTLPTGLDILTSGPTGEEEAWRTRPAPGALRGETRPGRGLIPGLANHRAALAEAKPRRAQQAPR